MQEFDFVPTESIKVDRPARQRSDNDPGDLVDSIRRLGVLNPIIIHRDDFSLVAGERRLQAAKTLGLPVVPVRFFENLPASTAQIIELEENLKRKDLPWRDQVKAIALLHELYMKADPKWTQVKTAAAVGLYPGHVSEYLRVWSDIDNPMIAQAQGMKSAYNMLSRRDERAADEAFSEIMEAGATFFDDEPEQLAPGVATPPRSEPRVAPTSETSILLADFITWAPSYTGPKFNFIHCDFPYGIEVFSGPQSGKQKWENYVDEANLYWKLIETLCNNLDRLMAHEAHLMFWFSMEHYTSTIARFAQLAPGLAFSPFPLVWTKSDNVGILPDPKRGPRRIYETALVASREDRLIAHPVSNSYPAPTNKLLHPSTKPEPVLRHFFEMFVDGSTRMLDPTCGSGSSLRAAESLGAKHVLGLEVSEEYCAGAQAALRAFRAMRAVKA